MVKRLPTPKIIGYVNAIVGCSMTRVKKKNFVLFASCQNIVSSTKTEYIVILLLILGCEMLVNTKA